MDAERREPLEDLVDAQALDRARTQTRRLSRLAADLLDLSRLDAQVQLRSEPVELSELSRAVIYGSVMGSFCCERFGVERFRTLERPEIDNIAADAVAGYGQRTDVPSATFWSAWRPTCSRAYWHARV